MVLRCLPLKEDHDEYKTVLRCVTGLLQQEQPQVVDSLPALTRTLLECIATDKIKSGTGQCALSRQLIVFTAQLRLYHVPRVCSDACVVTAAAIDWILTMHAFRKQDDDDGAYAARCREEPAGARQRHQERHA